MLNDKLFNLIHNDQWDKLNHIIKTNDDLDVNIKDESGKFIINYAVASNKVETVGLLISRGAKLDILESNGKTILYIPIEFKYKKMLELLLFFNKSSVGASLVDYPDDSGKIALHYSINLKNIEMCQMLLDEGSNVNLEDNNYDNALTLAIKTKSLELCKLIIKYKPNINYRKPNNGETPLIIACSIKSKEIAMLLLENGADPNIQDIDNEYAPIDYSISFGDADMVSLLLKHKADINLQDYYGNSPLMNAIKNGYMNIVDIIMENGEIVMNPNIYNIDLKLPLHIILEKKVKLLDEHLRFFIQFSDLNFQDSNGISPLHLIVADSDKLWKKFRDVLEAKNLDIFIKTKKGDSVISIIDERKSTDDFMDVVVKSYLFVLRGANHEWGSDWENLCRLENLGEDNLKALLKIVGDDYKGKHKDICFNVVYNKIMKQIKEGKASKCMTSYPLNKLRKCITSVSDGETVNYCKFTGIAIDVLLGLLYLLKKHSITCSLLSTNKLQNSKLCEYYKTAGIITETGCDFINFEIAWVNGELFISDDFADNFRKCIKRDSKYILIPLGIELDIGNHANYIIYDVEKMEMERFEPYGYKTPFRFDYDPDKLDNELYEKFKEVNSKIIYVKPKDFMPKIGFQLLDAIEENTSKIGDPGGFCALWSIWYADMRLIYSDIERADLVKELIKDIKTNNISFKNIIRNYSKNIVELRDKIFSGVGITINEWINDKMTKEQYIMIIAQLNKIIDSINI